MSSLSPTSRNYELQSQRDNKINPLEDAADKALNSIEKHVVDFSVEQFSQYFPKQYQTEVKSINCSGKSTGDQIIGIQALGRKLLSPKSPQIIDIKIISKIKLEIAKAKLEIQGMIRKTQGKIEAKKIEGILEKAVARVNTVMRESQRAFSKEYETKLQENVKNEFHQLLPKEEEEAPISPSSSSSSHGRTPPSSNSSSPVSSTATTRSATPTDEFGYNIDEKENAKKEMTKFANEFLKNLLDRIFNTLLEETEQEFTNNMVTNEKAAVQEALVNIKRKIAKSNFNIETEARKLNPEKLKTMIEETLNKRVKKALVLLGKTIQFDPAVRAKFEQDMKSEIQAFFVKQDFIDNRFSF